MVAVARRRDGASLEGPAPSGPRLPFFRHPERSRRISLALAMTSSPTANHSLPHQNPLSNLPDLPIPQSLQQTEGLPAH